jgi:hypothetical protein
MPALRGAVFPMIWISELRIVFAAIGMPSTQEGAKMPKTGS